MKQAINHSKDGGTPENDQKNRPRDSEELIRTYIWE